MLGASQPSMDRAATAGQGAGTPERAPPWSEEGVPVANPDQHITCCLCGGPVPPNSDVYALDEEWHRRYPRMRGVLACYRCVLYEHRWICRSAHRTFVIGHRPARHCCPQRDTDSWSHILDQGTPAAMARAYRR